MVLFRVCIKTTALCISLLRSAELENAPLSVHSYLTLMKNLGKIYIYKYIIYIRLCVSYLYTSVHYSGSPLVILH